MMKPVRWDSVLVGFNANHVVANVPMFFLILVVLLSEGRQFVKFKIQILVKEHCRKDSDLELDFNLLALGFRIGVSFKLPKEIQAMMRAPLSAFCRLDGMSDELRVVPPNLLIERRELIGKRLDGPLRHRDRLSPGSLHCYWLMTISRWGCCRWERHVASRAGAGCDARFLGHLGRIFRDAVCQGQGRAIREGERSPVTLVDLTDAGSRRRRGSGRGISLQRRRADGTSG